MNETISSRRPATFEADATEAKLRLEMRERLYVLMQARCADKDPKAVAVTAIEALLFKSVEGSTERYVELLQDQDAISTKLKEVGTRILLRKLQQKQKKLGFRNTMVLKGIATGSKTIDMKGLMLLSRNCEVSKGNSIGRARLHLENAMDGDNSAGLNK
jgi:hypothetical protein